MDLATLFRYDRWATDALVECTVQLSPEQFVHEFAGDLSSVRQQAFHLISVKDRYRARLCGEPVPDLTADAFQRPGDLLPYAAEVADRTEAMVAGISADRMAEVIRHDTRRGPFLASVAETLVHVVNHGTYHRGQVAALLKMHGVDPTDTDLIIWRNLSALSA